MGSTDHLFRAGDPRTIEAARRGALTRHHGPQPWQGTELDLMDEAGLVGPSWDPWRWILTAIRGEPLPDEGLEFFRRHTGRQEPPTGPVREAWIAAGRRGGKSRIAALVNVHRAVTFDRTGVAAGETPVAMILAGDKRQARVVRDYCEGFLTEVPALRPYLDEDRILRESIELRNGVRIEVHRSHYGSVRGRTLICAILDEIATWATDEYGQNPDSEIVAAVRPGLLTIPGSLLMAISSPYAAKGTLWEAYDKHFGDDESGTLVVNAATTALNPSVKPEDLADAFETDPARALSEHGDPETGLVQFRTDVAALFDASAVRAVVMAGVRELPPRGQTRYFGFCDPSGGSGDSFTLAVAHPEDGVAVLDCLREIRPPFSPDDATAELAATLKSYGLSTVTGDRYALEWVAERFARHGIQYKHAAQVRSELYLGLLPLVNAQTCRLLDSPALIHQLVALERKTSRSGRDSIDHPRGSHDDLANSAAGALVMAAPQPTRPEPSFRLI